MINSQMRTYNYFTFGDDNGYGQAQLSTTPKGQVKIAINTTSTTIQDNVRYKDAAYIGLTHSNALDDKCVIEYGAEKLKVLYIVPFGRYKQVFLKNL